MGFDFGMDEMCATALFKTVLHFFIQPPKFFLLHFKVGQVACYTISEPSFKTLPRQCSDPSALKKVRWDSILAWIKCSATALFKTVLHFFIQPPQIFFYCTSRLVK